MKDIDIIDLFSTEFEEVTESDMNAFANVDLTLAKGDCGSGCTTL